MRFYLLVSFGFISHYKQSSHQLKETFRFEVENDYEYEI